MSGRHKNKMTSVYPKPEAVAIIGGYSSPLLNSAIECWAQVLLRAGKAIENTLSREDWPLLADVLAGDPPDPSSPDPGRLLAEHVQAAHHLRDLGNRFFGDRRAARAVEALVKNLNGFEYDAAWVAIIACCWYWDHGDDVGDVEWWKVGARRG